MKRRYKIPLCLLLSGVTFMAVVFGMMLLLNRRTIFAETDISSITDYNPPQTSWIYDAEGNSILCFAIERRTLIPFEKMGGLLPKAVIVAEDRHFYSRWGPVDFWRAPKAVWEGKGGSTISQQLSRLMYLQEEKRREEYWAARIKEETKALDEKYTRRARFWQNGKILYSKVGKGYAKYFRKIRETYIAWRLEKAFGRERILEIYLNHVYFGERYGLYEASQAYFSKAPDELNLEEAALIAGLIRSPYYSSPFRNPEKARELRNRVLQQFADSGMLSPDAAAELKEKPLELKRGLSCKDTAPHFAELIRRDLARRYSTEEIWKGGLKIYTTLDSKAQKAAEVALGESLEKLKERNPELAQDIRGAAVVIDVKTGAIRVWVEEPEFSENEYDLINQAHRQVGSAFKAIFYGKLLERGWRLRCDDEGSGPCKLYDFEPKVAGSAKKKGSYTGVWIPMGRGKDPHPIQNFPYEGIPRYRGTISPQVALTESRNAATESAVRGTFGSIAQPFWQIEIEGELEDFAKRVGITSKIDPSLTTPIGSTEVTLLEMTRAFATYARGCKKLGEYMVEGIKNAKNEPVEWHKPEEPQQVCDEKTYLQIVRGLRGVVELPHGTGSQAKSQLGFQVFVKTGTATNNAGEATDNWLIGCTPSYCMGVWVGRDKKLPLGEKETGGKNALPVFISTMKAIYQDKEKETFPDATDPMRPFAMPKENSEGQPKAEEPAEPTEPEKQDDF
ncbi:MAG: transglycosylase domain-containing protein [Candidatus Sungiibacteriota bacterium]